VLPAAARSGADEILAGVAPLADPGALAEEIRRRTTAADSDTGTPWKKRADG